MSRWMKIAALGAGVLALAPSAWAQLPNPSPEANRIGTNNPCSDPWVSYAVSVVKTSGGVVGRAAGSGSSHECNPQLYNGAKWSSYDELVRHVRATRAMLESQGVRYDMVRGAPGLVIFRPNPATFISNDGGSFVSNDGGSFISNNGGTFISNNGGTFMSNNGGTIVAPGYSLKSADGARLSFRLPGGQQLRVR